jgi:hypothetical protein
MCTDLFGATAPVVVLNRVGRLLLIMSKAAACKIDFKFFIIFLLYSPTPLHPYDQWTGKNAVEAKVGYNRSCDRSEGITPLGLS